MSTFLDLLNKRVTQGVRREEQAPVCLDPELFNRLGVARRTYNQESVEEQVRKNKDSSVRTRASSVSPLEEARRELEKLEEEALAATGYAVLRSTTGIEATELGKKVKDDTTKEEWQRFLLSESFVEMKDSEENTILDIGKAEFTQLIAAISNGEVLALTSVLDRVNAGFEFPTSRKR